MTNGQDETDHNARLDALIERSSLGTQGARKLRARIPVTEARRINRLAGTPSGNRLLLVYEVPGLNQQGYGERNSAVQLAATLMTEALSTAGLPDGTYEAGFRRSGGLVLLPDGAEDAVGRIVGAMADGLRRVNTDLTPKARFRLRLVVATAVAAPHGFDDEAVSWAEWLLNDISGQVPNNRGDFVAVIEAGLDRQIITVTGSDRGKMIKAEVEAEGTASIVHIYISAPSGGMPRPPAGWQES